MKFEPSLKQQIAIFQADKIEIVSGKYMIN